MRPANCAYCGGPLGTDKAPQRRLHVRCLRFYEQDKKAETRARQRGDPDAPPAQHSHGAPRKFALCSVPGCGKAHNCKGFCRLHFERRRRAEWKKEGRCGKCGGPNEESRWVFCERCRERQRGYAAR